MKRAFNVFFDQTQDAIKRGFITIDRVTLTRSIRKSRSQACFQQFLAAVNELPLEERAQWLKAAQETEK